MKICMRPMLLVAAVSCCLPAGVEAQIKPIVTGRSQFRIPFTFDSQEVRQRGLSEVQLFVSRDRGKTWKHTSSTLPTGQKFSYRATEDGEYHFAVRTLDRDRNLHPDGPLSAGLIVRVDTAKPKVELSVQQRPGGDTAAAWSCQDTNLDTNTLRVEYRPQGETRWVKLPCRKSATGAVILPPDTGPLVIRAIVSDAAGNTGETQTPWNPVRIVPAANVNMVGPSSADPVVTDAMFEPPQRATLGTNSPPLLPPARSAQDPKLSTPDVIGPFDLPKVASATTADVVAAEKPEPGVAREQTLDASVPQVINKRRFSLEYGLEGVGSSGVGSVDVFITEDDGKKWWRYGADRDKQSPVVLQVPRDGRYGFVISARSGAGLGDPPPSPGDKPHTTVIVDRTPPRARFDLVRLSDDGKHLEVNWVAEDANLHDKPIRIEHARTENGPWLPMGEWRANSGKLEWQVALDLPAHIFVRMLARDAAGNTGQLVYPKPILVDVSRPRARINSIRVSAP